MRRKPLIGLCEATRLYGSVSVPRPRYVPDGCCEWCGQPITNKRRTSCCSAECTRNFNTATSTVYYANIGSRGGYGNHIMRRDNYTCQDCGEFHARYNSVLIPLPTTDGKLEIHHIKPVQFGGNDAPDNLVVLCKDCHKGRHRSNHTPS